MYVQGLESRQTRFLSTLNSEVIQALQKESRKPVGTTGQVSPEPLGMPGQVLHSSGQVVQGDVGAAFPGKVPPKRFWEVQVPPQLCEVGQAFPGKVPSKRFWEALCDAVSSQKRLEAKRGSTETSEHVQSCLAAEVLRDGKDKAKILEVLKRAHQNLGHPGVERFCGMLKSAGASIEALRMARELRCEVCEAQTGLKAPKISKVKSTYDFNKGVCTDTFEVSYGGRKIHALSIICEGTHFHLVVPLWGGKSAGDTRRAYRRYWKSAFGSPYRLFTDGGSEFQGAFHEGLCLDGTLDERASAYAPWQNSLAERHGQTWKHMYERVVATVPPQTNDELEEVFAQVTMAKNTLVNRSGFSPFQRVFGVQSRIPGMLDGDEDHVGVNSAILCGDDSYFRANQIRVEARKAFVERDNDDRIRRAIERRTRPERGPFPAGAKVYVWRPGGLKGSSKAHRWRGPGTVIGHSDQSKFWVSFGSKVLKCAPEQLRRLSPDAEAAVRLVPHELVDWEKAVSSRGVATFHDISAGEIPQETDQVTAGQDYWQWTSTKVRRVHVIPRKERYLPTLHDVPPLPLDQLGDRRVTTIERASGRSLVLADNWRRDVTAVDEFEEAWTGFTEFPIVSSHPRPDPVESEAKRARVAPAASMGEEYAGQGPSAVRAQAVGLERDSSMGSTAEHTEEVVSDPDNLPLDVDLGGSEPPAVASHHAVASAVADAQPPSSYGPIRSTPLSRAMRNDLNLLDLGQPSSATRSSDAVEVAQDTQVSEEVLEARALVQDIRRGVGKRPARPTGHDHRVQLPQGRLRQSTMDNEWSFPDADENAQEVYVNESYDQVKHLIPDREAQENAGKRKELEKLLKYEAISIVAPTAAAQVRLRTQRILPSRFVITHKPDEKNPGQYVVKARWCIRGYLDPDATLLRTQSPTLSAEALGLVLQLCSSNAWSLVIADIEGAFLQGDKLERERGELYVELPPGGIPGVEVGSLMKIEKAVYGLVDAPRAWHTKLRKTLLELGLRQSVLDPCLYYYWGSTAEGKRELQGVLTVHVDDLLMAGSYGFQTLLGKLRQRFPFKHWKEREGEFLGRYIKQCDNGEILIGQEEYASKLKPIEIARERRRQKDSAVTEAERRQLRGIGGALNWLATATRPDLCSMTAYVQQKTKDATVQDLVEANKAIAEAWDHRKVQIVVRPIPLHDLVLLVVADASWTTKDDLRSQGAYMVCATSKAMLTGKTTILSPLKWKSQKQERAVSSTLAAELLTVSKGVAECTWSRQFFLEASYEDYSLDTAQAYQDKIHIIAVTDNKPLHDHARSDQGIVQDKRLAIEMLLLRRDLLKNAVTLRWIDTAQMLVDCMTKLSVRPSLMRYVMRTGRYTIHEEQEMLDARKTQRVQRHTSRAQIET